MSEPAVITIDGPSGTGKGTLAMRLARRLGWHLLDSGVLYRVLAWVAGQQGLPTGQNSEIAALATGLQVELVPDSGTEPARVRLDGEDISDQIRSEECGSAASVIAASTEVRQAILQWQRDFRRPPGLIADGRDMGTVVFPDAGLKIYLTAGPQERAKRRYKQLNAKGIDANLPRLSTEMAERDARDRQRAISPLAPAADAAVIDTTAVRPDAVFEKVWQLYQGAFGDPGGNGD
ncbi:MAG: (d)CMP kinase [Gammaproteobacteria bacterium]